MDWIRKVGNIFFGADGFDKTVYESYNLLKGVGFALLLFTMYLFHFSAIFTAMVSLTILNIVASIHKARGRESGFNPYRNPEMPIMLFTATISSVMHYRIVSIAGLDNRYHSFLNNFRDFLLQYSIREPNFHFIQFIEGFYGFVISGGHILEVFMFIFQLLAISLYFKAVFGFIYLFLNDERLIEAYDKHSRLKKSDIESEKEDAENSERWVFGSWRKYASRPNIIFVFSTGVPYWIVIAMIYLANS